METAIPTASSMLGISSDTNSGISLEQTNNTINTNIGTNNNATNSNRTLLLSAIFNPTSSSSSSSSSSTFFDASPNLQSTSSFTQTTIQDFLNWSSSQAGHESSVGHTTSTANDSFLLAVSPTSSTTDGLSSMRVVRSTKVTSSPMQPTSEDTWDESVLIAASLFILALSLVAIALRILCPLYYHIMGHNESKEPRERHSSGRDQPRQTDDAREREEITPSTNSEEVLIPFGTPATHMRPIMNYGHPCTYQYPLTYMPYQGTTLWSPQAYEQDYIINQPIQHDIPQKPSSGHQADRLVEILELPSDIPQKPSSGHQADRLVEILELPSDHLNMGAIYRHNWDQLFDGVANESMLSYVGHPSEYRSVPASYNTKL